MYSPLGLLIFVALERTFCMFLNDPPTFISNWKLVLIGTA